MGTENKIYDIDLKKLEDRSVGLLALAADKKQSESGRGCLSNQDLAALVDGEAIAGERENCFKHLADCDLCYQQWVEISAFTGLNAGKKSKTIIQQLFQPKVLTWAGSALAVAASVVVFFNVRGDVDLPYLQQDMQQNIQMESKILFDPFPPPEPESIEDELKNDLAMPLEAAPAVVEEGLNPVPVLKNMEVANRAIVRKKSIESALVPAVKLEVSERQADIIVEEESREPAAVTVHKLKARSAEQRSHGSNESRLKQYRTARVEQWIFTVKKGCAGNQSQESTLFWEKKLLEGKILLYSMELEQSTPGGLQEKKIIEQLVLEIEQLYGQLNEGVGNFDTCTRILKQIKDYQ